MAMQRKGAKEATVLAVIPHVSVISQLEGLDHETAICTLTRVLVRARPGPGGPALGRTGVDARHNRDGGAHHKYHQASRGFRLASDAGQRGAHFRDAGPLRYGAHAIVVHEQWCGS